MILVGLTGGIAAGKSTVASMFAERGAAVVDADRIAHRLQEPGGACHQEIVEAFGREILDASGRIDRQRLGARAFADPSLRQRLEAIMHPAIWAACESEIGRAEAAGRSVCVVEAALILETGQQGPVPEAHRGDRADGGADQPPEGAAGVNGGSSATTPGGAMVRRGQGAPRRLRDRQRRRSGGYRGAGRAGVQRSCGAGPKMRDGKIIISAK